MVRHSMELRQLPRKRSVARRIGLLAAIYGTFQKGPTGMLLALPYNAAILKCLATRRQRS